MNEHKTIEQTIDEISDEEFALSPLAKTLIVTALVEREQQIVDHLAVIGNAFNLHPHIVAQAVVVLGLGEPPTDEVKALIESQYHALLNALRQQMEQKAQMLRAMGVPVEMPDFTDPMTVTVSEVPDSPPES